jgi:hypothetical protein
MKNSSDTIGNRTRDLPAASAVPQPTAPPRAPVILHTSSKLTIEVKEILVILSRYCSNC